MTRVAGLGSLALQPEALTVGSSHPASSEGHDLVAIYAGTNEVQRDLIARSLPLPRAR